MPTLDGDSPLDSLTPEMIARAVAERYGNVATAPTDKHGFPVGRAFAEQVGYSKSLLDWAPSIVVDSFTGAGNPRPFIAAPLGAHALDIGCGVGLDALCTAREIGPTGTVVGLDFSESMIDTATQGAKQAGLQNIRFVCASAAKTPFVFRWGWIRQ